MLYDIAFFIFSLIYLPTLLFKGKLHADFKERFGRYGPEKSSALRSAKGAIWIQAVSVGEVAALKAFIPLIKAEYPGRAIVLSTITKTGYDLAEKLFSKDAIIIYFPLDFSFTARKAVGMIRPDLYIMVETEIWPNVIKEVSAQGGVVAMINGRISDRSIRKYMMVKPLLKGTLDKVSLFCMQSELDGKRMVEMGAPEGRVKVTGNMKFDIDVSVRPDTARIREALGLKPQETLIVAGSTHKGEEEIVLEAFRDLTKDFKDLKLLIAPRHIERIDDVEVIAKRYGFEVARTSSPHESRVLMLDTIGQLRDIYSVATIVFIGGSLIRHGGQNPIEAAIYEKAVIFGPYMFNFKDIAAALLKNYGAVEVSNAADLREKIRLLLQNDSARERFGHNAKRIVSTSGGAARSNLEAIRSIL